MLGLAQPCRSSEGFGLYPKSSGKLLTGFSVRVFVCVCVWGCQHLDMGLTVLIRFLFATIILRVTSVLNCFVPRTLLSVW